MEQILTIGMATFDDFSNLRSTIQAIRINNEALMPRVRFLVVDNNPRGKHTISGINFAQRVGPQCTYVGYGERFGTCSPRQRVFESASTPWVLCIDSHVLLYPRALPALLEHIDKDPESNDLLSGPVVLDNLSTKYSQFDDVWRSQMRGTWGQDPRMDGTEPFEIDGMGLGLFAARKEQWLKVGGFHPKFLGFGGGEFYIHEKFRRAGGKCLCLPEVKWAHQWEFPEGRKYPNTHWHRARNQVIGHHELGRPFDGIKASFVDTGLVSQAAWQLLMANPADPPELPPRGLGMILPKKVNGQVQGKPTLLVPDQKHISGRGGVGAAASAKRQGVKTVAELPCVYRGNVIETRDCKPCEGGPREVFQCSAVPGGECTLNSSKLKNDAGKIPGCAICELRSEIVQLATNHA